MTKLTKLIIFSLFYINCSFILAAQQISGGAALSTNFITQDALDLGDEGIQAWANIDLTDSNYASLWTNIGDFDELDLTLAKKWQLQDFQVVTNISYFSIPGDGSIIVPEITATTMDNAWYLKMQHWNFTNLDDEDGMTYAFGYNRRWELANNKWSLVFNGESKYIDRSKYDQGWIATLDARLYKDNYFMGARVGHNRLNSVETHYQFLVGVTF
jgi:hypothetical protein